MYYVQCTCILYKIINCHYRQYYVFILLSLLSVYLSKKQLYVAIKNAITVFVSVNIFKKVINIKIKI